MFLCMMNISLFPNNGTKCQLYKNSVREIVGRRHVASVWMIYYEIFSSSCNIVPWCRPGANIVWCVYNNNSGLFIKCYHSGSLATICLIDLLTALHIRVPVEGVNLEKCLANS